MKSGGSGGLAPARPAVAVDFVRPSGAAPVLRRRPLGGRRCAGGVGHSVAVAGGSCVRQPARPELGLEVYICNRCVYICNRVGGVGLVCLHL